MGWGKKKKKRKKKKRSLYTSSTRDDRVYLRSSLFTAAAVLNNKLVLSMVGYKKSNILYVLLPTFCVRGDEIIPSTSRVTW